MLCVSKVGFAEGKLDCAESEGLEQRTEKLISSSVSQLGLSAGFEVGLDDSSNTIKRKIRDAQLQLWNYMLVVSFCT